MSSSSKQLTPSKSWAPSRSEEAAVTPPEAVASEDSFEQNLAGAKRGSSTLARLTRSVSKLGSKNRERKRQEKEEKAAAKAAAKPNRRLMLSDAGSAAAPSAPAGFAPAPSALRSAKAAGTQDFAASTEARIKMFEEGHYNLDSDLGALTEKGVERLRADLGSLSTEVAQHLKLTVHQHYGDFVQATPGLLRLEAQVQQLRSLLHNMAALMASLDGTAAAVAAAQAAAAEVSSARQQGGGEGAEEAAWRASSEGAKWHDHMDEADVAVAERRVPDALALLRKLERLLSRLQASAAQTADAGLLERADALQQALSQRRKRLIPLIHQQLMSPLASPADIRRGAELFAAAAGQAQAHATALEAFSASLRRAEEALLTPANAGGGDPEGCDYAAALAQKLVLTVGQAFETLGPAFQAASAGHGRAYAAAAEAEAALEQGLAAARAVWALQQAERACGLLRKHALLPFAAPAGLGATCRCVFAFLAFAGALQAGGGPGAQLPLEAVLLAELAPVVEAVLAKRVRRLGEQLRKAVEAEVDRLAPTSARRSGAAAAGPGLGTVDGSAAEGEGKAGALLPQAIDLTSWDSLAQALPSADYLLDELEFLGSDLARLPCHHRLWAAARKAASELYQAYTAALAGALGRALKYAASDEARERAAMAAEAAMEACTLLVERLMPEAVAQLSEAWGGELCDADQLAEHLMRMGEALGMTTVPLVSPAQTVGLEVEASRQGGAADAPAAAQVLQEGSTGYLEDEDTSELFRRASSTAG